MSRKKRGVYILSNDKMYDLTITFLNSFRKYNDSINLCMIPFDEDCEKVLSLSDNYHFDVFSDVELLKQCDMISQKFHGHKHGSYRKLAIWEGEFDEFIYVDVDTVILANFDFCFNFLEEYGCVTSHSNLSNLVQFVWKRSILDKRVLTYDQLAYSANTGFIISKKGFITSSSVLERLDNALYLRNDMELECQEQPFLNYMIVTSGHPYTSLLSLHFSGHSGIKLEMWAGIPKGRVEAGQMHHQAFKAPVLLVHWAGVWRHKKMPYYELWKYYRDLL